MLTRNDKANPLRACLAQRVLPWWLLLRLALGAPVSWVLDAMTTIFLPPPSTASRAGVRVENLLSLGTGSDGSEAGGREGSAPAGRAPWQPSCTQGPASRPSVHSVSWRGKGRGRQNSSQHFKEFWHFLRAHVIFKLILLSTPSCLPWLPQVNL